jgi:hypothetical protein
MSNSIVDHATLATRILAPFADGAKIMGERRESAAAFTSRVNVAHLTGYAEAVLVIASLMARGAWTTGKQKGGTSSTSVLLKEAIEAQADVAKVNARRAKRIVECAAAILKGRKKIDAIVHAAAAGDGLASTVLSAFAEVEIKTEADLLRHVTPPPAKDDVAEIFRRIEGLDKAQLNRLQDMVDALHNERAKNTDKPAKSKTDTAQPSA